VVEALGLALGRQREVDGPGHKIFLGLKATIHTNNSELVSLNR
jgi:hypothetical protein